MLATVLLLAAEGTTLDPISGGAGWVGAGLLGLVLAWLLLKHLPAKDAQITEFILHFETMAAKKDARMDSQRSEYLDSLAAARTEFTANQNALVTTFRQESSAEREACERHFKVLADSINASLGTVGNQLNEHSKRNQQWLDLLKQQLASYPPEELERVKAGLPRKPHGGGGQHT